MEADDTILSSAARDATLQVAALPTAARGTELQDTRLASSLELTHAASSGEALLEAERLRTVRVAPLMITLSLIAAATLPLFGGNPWAKLALYSTMTAGALCLGFLWWRAERGQVVDSWLVDVAWGLSFSATCANTVYFGIYSPAPVLMTMAVVIFAQGQSRRLALGAYITAALTQGTVAALDGLGIASDPGILRASHLPAIEQVAGQALVQVLLLAAYVLGRSARRAATRAIEQVHHAVRELQRREVVALEAKDKVRRALNIGGAGRLSGVQLGKYTLAEVLGHGGMGEVYRAQHIETSSQVAIKVIHAHLCHDDEVVQRFLREAQVSASLKSEFVVRTLEAGQSHEGPFLVMELLEGQDLAEQMRERGLCSLDELQRLARQVGAGLDVARSVGIVHRDIKPQNLFMTRCDDESGSFQCKILDFGVARAVSGYETLTVGGAVFGTPAYMAPEQASGLTVDHRTDLYALMAVLYRAGTGFLPASGDSAPAILFDVVHGRPRPPSAYGLPESLDAFFAKGFAKNPDKRYQSGRELSEAFAKLR